MGRGLLDVLLSQSQAAPAQDRRFSHDVWRDSGYYRRLMQGSSCSRDSLNRMLDRADATPEDREQARFRCPW
ncbi:MAG: hypothetical protein R3E65_12205 [Steroidobacteraceae bacterium]